jgi:SAM-dependent methyltransferase
MTNRDDATRRAWESGIEREITWWRRYLAGGGLEWPEEYRFRFDPDAPLQPHVAQYLPVSAEPPRLLDCAAGPATTLGKVLDGRRVEIVAIDALATAYAGILGDLGLVSPVPTIAGEVERLDEVVSTGAFDLVYMRFALDHCYDPRMAMRQMVRAARPGGTVLVEHYRDPAQTAFEGLRQWQLVPRDGDLVVENSRASFRVGEAVPGVRVEVYSTPTWLTLLLRAPLNGARQPE